MALVYLLTNMNNGKRYVGKTVTSLGERWRGHAGSARRGDNAMMICRAIKKHGPDAFFREIIEECDESVVNEREQVLIKEFRSHMSQGGYNMTWGGEGTTGYRHTPEAKEKMRRKATGRKHTPETIALFSEKKRGVKQSPEGVAARAKANRGKKRSLEQRRNITIGLTGHAVSKQARVNIAVAAKGRVTSETTKAKFKKVVEQLTLEGELLMTFESLNAASAAMNSDASIMSRLVRNECTYKGYRWRYKTPVKPALNEQANESVGV